MADSSQARQILQKYDADRNGYLDIHEWRLLVAELRQHQSSISDDVLRVFLAFDADRNGHIDARELAAMLAHLGLDADSDGVCDGAGGVCTDGVSLRRLRRRQRQRRRRRRRRV